MFREEVSSSSLASIGYDADSAILEVEFRSGEVYHYYGVPQHVVRSMTVAESMGQYFVRFVRSGYPFCRVE